ncbi:MAG: VOC family protein [Chloroflexi bacterium]|nr:VOC family protein [Chloroflexota bacterium]
MIVRLDHVGVVANSFGEASDVLVERLGFPLELSRTNMPEGNLYEPQNTRIFFVKVGLGETLIEILIPQDTQSGIARYLAKRGPGLHHLGYACDSVPEETQRLRDRGLEPIQIGTMLNGVFFYPKSAMGILTELVTVRP